MNLPFVVETDASNVGLGAVAHQVHADPATGRSFERPVAYLSRALSRTEQGYSASEREALAVVWACEQLRVCLHGHMFTLRTDHQPLRWVLGGERTAHQCTRLLHWAIRLQEHSFDFAYQPGRLMVAPMAMPGAPGATRGAQRQQ